MRRRQARERALLLERSQEYACAILAFIEPEQLPTFRLIDGGVIGGIGEYRYVELHGVASRVGWIRRCGAREGCGIRPAGRGVVEDEERIADQSRGLSQCEAANGTLANEIEFPTERPTTGGIVSLG